MGQISTAGIEAVQFIELGQFITVTIGLVTLILGVAAIVFSKIGSVSERVAVTEKQNEGDENNFKVLFSKVEYLEKERHNDKILYNEAINKLNITLGKIESTLENNNTIVRELKAELNNRNDR